METLDRTVTMNENKRTIGKNFKTYPLIFEQYLNTESYINIID